MTQEEKDAACKRAYKKAHREEIKTASRLYIAGYRKLHPEKVKQSYEKWRKNNLSYDNIRSMKRHTAKLKRIPIWLSSDDFALIKMQYDLAHYLTECTGIKWHVDHIIPLQGRNISGLHVPSNLRVVPASENCSKSNR